MAEIPLGKNQNVVFRVAHLEQIVDRRRHANPGSWMIILFEDAFNNDYWIIVRRQRTAKCKTK